MFYRFPFNVENNKKFAANRIMRQSKPNVTNHYLAFMTISILFELFNRTRRSRSQSLNFKIRIFFTLNDNCKPLNRINSIFKIFFTAIKIQNRSNVLSENWSQSSNIIKTIDFSFVQINFGFSFRISKQKTSSPAANSSFTPRNQVLVDTVLMSLLNPDQDFLSRYDYELTAVI